GHPGLSGCSPYGWEAWSTSPGFPGGRRTSGKLAANYLFADKQTDAPVGKAKPINESEMALSYSVRIAEPALIKVYGKHQIDNEKLLTATLENGVWNVYGTLWCRDRNGRRTSEIGKCVGGVAALKLRQSDGKILSISHTM